MKLNDNQKKFMRMCLEGKHAGDMAQEMGVSLRAVESRLKALCNKYDTTNRYGFMSKFVTIPNDVEPTQLDGINSKLHKLGLAEKQREVAYNVIIGLSYKDIAEVLNIKYKTVQHHLNLVFKKLKIKNREELKQMFDSKNTILAYHKKIAKNDNKDLILPTGVS